MVPRRYLWRPAGTAHGGWRGAELPVADPLGASQTLADECGFPVEVRPASDHGGAC